MNLDFNPEFKHALDRMEDPHRHVFITGRAGTGKSTLLDYFRRHHRTSLAVLAPTGVAALNVKGQTIHRFFNFGVDVTPEKIEQGKIRPRNPPLFKRLETLLIDEVSMLRADLLDCIDLFLKRYGPDLGSCFGGVRMIFIGDLYQLPPVVDRTQRDLFRTHYQTPYFFSAKALENLTLDMIELKTVYRQKEHPFVDLLDKIRHNSINDTDLAALNRRCQSPVEPAVLAATTTKVRAIILTTTNAKADAINDAHLNALDEPCHSHEAVIRGDFGRDHYPTATQLRFKRGAQIMLLNNDGQKRWVNGSLGLIVDLARDEEDREYIRIELRDDDCEVAVYPFTWEVYRFTVVANAIATEAIGSFIQYPFRLAWAVTIHKSQGKSFDRVTLDLGRGAFASGQVYVALSRCTTWDGLTLHKPISRHDIRVDQRISRFFDKYR